MEFSFSRGTLWSGIGQYYNQLASLLTAIILGRILSPEDFGIVAVILIVNGFFQVFSSSGLGSAIVQFRELGRRDYNSIWTLTVVFGVGLFLLIFLSSSHISRIFGNSTLENPIKLGGVGVLLVTIEQYVNGLYVKDFKFKLRAHSTIISSTVGAICGIVLASNGAGFYALIFQILLKPLIFSLLGLITLKHLPRFSFDRIVIKKVFGYVRNLTLFQLFNYGSRNLDSLLIGKFLGVVALGYYSRAYTLMVLPIVLLTNVISPVIHSRTSYCLANKISVKEEYLKILREIAVICCPVMLLCSLYAPEVIDIIWGSQWDKSYLPFAILALAGLHQPLLSTTGPLLIGLNKDHSAFIWSIISFFLYGTGIIIGLPYGLSGIATGYVVASYLLLIGLFWYVFAKVLFVSIGEVIRVITPGIIGIVVVFTIYSSFGLLLLSGLTRYNQFFLILVTIVLGLVMRYKSDIFELIT